MVESSVVGSLTGNVLAEDQPAADPKRNTSRDQESEVRHPKKRHGARNQHRHKIFVKWLLQTFPFLNEKSGLDADTATDEEQSKEPKPKWHVLDVAGGKGETAARLALCHNRRVIMVDPRPTDLVHCYETVVLPRLPNKWQRRLAERMEEDQNTLEKIVQRRFRQMTTCFTDQALEEDGGDPDMIDAVQRASLLVGLHADGATEAIVNAALRFQKPFVVVPCCVFPNFFTQRQVSLADGRRVPVRSHDEFCQYLLQKDERFREATVPFEGRNRAIWWDGT